MFKVKKREEILKRTNKTKEETKEFVAVKCTKERLLKYLCQTGLDLPRQGWK